jgi:hypothetical protein
MPADDLTEEQSYYLEVRSELLKTSEGKFVLIKGRKLIGTYDTGENAYADGIAKLGNVAMLITQVKREEKRDQVPALTLGLIHARLPQ